MIQGKAVIVDKMFCKDYFFSKVMKPFIGNIMKSKGKEISFVNQFLKTKVATLSTWKRKQPIKSNQCDVCSRIFVNQHGVNVHKKKMHGEVSVKQNKQVKSLLSVKQEETMNRSNSVSSLSDLSPPPKKINKHMKKKQICNASEKIEESGSNGHRDSDNKIDSESQCNIGNADKISELEEDLKLVKTQVETVNADSQKLKAHNTRKFNGYKAEYKELLEEKNKILEELMKVQSERDIAIAKVESMEKIAEEDQVDECIKDSRCNGDCEHVGCDIEQVQRLKALKELGGRRRSPAEEVALTPWKYCPQCNFKSRINNEVKEHVNQEHRSYPTCPFCNIGFDNLNALGRHIEQYHKDNGPASYQNRNAVKQTRSTVSRGPCIFFLQPRGCKKGANCDFSHSGAPQRVIKVRKLCLNGPVCRWKPRCRYIHLEDGETIPERAPREQERRAQNQVGLSGGATSSGNQGFGSPVSSLPPPGFSLTEYPGLPQPARKTMFRPWMSQ